MSIFRLKTGEVININEKPEFIKKETELNGKTDIETLILRTLISAGNPLRLSELAKQSNIYEEKLRYNINNMIKKGLILMAINEYNNKKYYLPQSLFWNYEILLKINENITTIMSGISKDMDYSQTENPDTRTPEPILNCLQMALKLFNFEISELRKEL